MSQADILDKVRAILAEQLGIEDSTIMPSNSFIHDLGVDFLDLLELVMALGEEFDIEIPDEAANKILTVQDVIDYINSELP
jgi:acyl carrier protein